MDGRKQRYPQKSRLTRALLTRFSFAFLGFTAVYAIVGFLVWRGAVSYTHLIYNQDLTDMTDILKEMLKDMKGTV